MVVGGGVAPNHRRFLFLVVRPQSQSGSVLSFCVHMFVKEKEVKVVVGGGGVFTEGLCVCVCV